MKHIFTQPKQKNYSYTTGPSQYTSAAGNHFLFILPSKTIASDSKDPSLIIDDSPSKIIFPLLKIKPVDVECNVASFKKSWDVASANCKRSRELVGGS